MNTREAATRVRRFPELRDKLVAAIPNGFDGAEFRGEPAAPQNGAFRIVHTGSLHTDFGRWQRRRRLVRRLLGGALPGVDFLTRSHVFLLEAVERLRAADPALGAKLEVHLAGPLTPDDAEVARRSPSVRAHGFLPHDETVRLIRSADLLFLPMHDVPEGSRVGIVPCKTYEYLASGRPILAAVPDGDARELLAEAGGAFLCRPADADAMAAIIAAELERWHSGTPTRDRREDVVRRHEARSMVGEIAAVYEAMAAGRGR
jgi:glycosyltransferase involved in cell wall biosynthesis